MEKEESAYFDELKRHILDIEYKKGDVLSFMMGRARFYFMAPGCFSAIRIILSQG